MISTQLKSIVAATALLAAAQASAQITFYEGEGFRGRAFSTGRTVTAFSRQGFNDQASSVVVDRGRWEVCENDNFDGRCVVLRRGSYDSLRGLGLENRISSVRPVDARRRGDYTEAPQPLAAPNYEYRRRPNEPVYEARVTSARAVMGAAEQRCWTERQQVTEGRRDLNVGGGVIGGILGGVLGHQVGGGGGKTAATIAGAVGGAAVGANIDRIRDRSTGQEVRRCDRAVSGPPQYWDVTYNYRGVDHHVQTATDPGTTIAVNRKGEPRQ